MSRFQTSHIFVILVTDFSQFFTHHKEMQPYIHNDMSEISDMKKLSEFKQSPEDVDKYLQFSVLY